MNPNRSKHRFDALLAAAVLSGMALLAGAEARPLEADKKVEVKGVIISRAGDLVKIQEKKSDKVDYIKLGDGTVIERQRGLRAFFRHKDMDVTALVPGLTIEAEGVDQSKGFIEAKKIKFNPDLFAIEVAEQQEIQANAAAAARSQTTAEQADAKSDAALNAADQAQNTAEAGLSAALVSGMDAVVVNQRLSDVADYVTVADAHIYFPNDSSIMDEDDKVVLDHLASALQGASGYLIEVAGYASSTGTAEHNQKLSEARAASVVHYLMEKDNVPMRRFVIPAGYGTSHPAAQNTDAQGRAFNRRVDVKILLNKGFHEGE